MEGHTIQAIEGDLWGEKKPLNQKHDLSDVRLLAPVDPPNIIAVGLNYKSHAAESGMTLPERPVLFLKATSSLAGPDDAIILPDIAPSEVDYECELAVVIGKTAKNVTAEEADGYIFGYTCGNDVSARDCQLRLDTQWARGKSFDTFCPIGPWIATGLDVGNLPIATRVNGETLQQSSTAQMIFSVRELVSFCSQNMTLLPGTIIMSGTPDGVGFARKPPIFLKPGDVVEVEIGGIGTLRNIVNKHI
jgi:2-keto-4-pentenoate hydratase/2-oxohepta-3-ene-1,7-dioic acid hydratase in catechol pathway